MYSILPFSLIGAVLFVGSLAAPAGPGGASYSYSYGVPSSTKNYSPSSTKSYSAGSTGSTFSLPDGFPNPNQKQLDNIEQQAHGTLPNGPPPPPGSISQQGLVNLRLIQFNENFEVAFFSSLLSNVTNNVSGFEIDDKEERKIIIDALTAVLAQEELHALNAGNALKSQNQDQILPCQYVFPTTTFDDAIVLAATFTDVVLGTLQDVIQIFAQNGDAGLTRGVASVVGQEGEQEGFYRLLQNKGLIPSALPFLTTSVRDFAFSALQGFVVKGSCPNQDLISKDLKIFGVLNLLTKNIKPVDQNLQFSIDIKTLQDSNISYQQYGKSYDWTKASLVYINQQNTPIVEKLQNVKVSGTVVTFEAFFPFTENLLNSLTIAAVTSNAGPFANAQAVANATLFAPGLIEVN